MIINSDLGGGKKGELNFSKYFKFKLVFRIKTFLLNEAIKNLLLYIYIQKQKRWYNDTIYTIIFMNYHGQSCFIYL